VHSHSDLTVYSRLTHSTDDIEEEQDISLWTVTKFLFSYTSPKQFVLISLAFTILAGVAFTMFAYPEILMILAYTKFDHDLLKERESYCIPILFSLAILVLITFFVEKALIMQTTSIMINKLRGSTYESLMKQPTEFYDKP
jgi:ABC-type multidrug transport system fused ATPase/permease subunit